MENFEQKPDQLSVGKSILVSIVLPALVVIVSFNLLSHAMHRIKAYDVSTRRKCKSWDCPRNTVWSLGSYQAIFGMNYSYVYKPQDKLPTSIAKYIPNYPNAKIFDLNLTAPSGDVHWVYGSFYFHTSDSLEQIEAFYQNAIKPSADTGNIQPSLTGIEFFEKDGYVNRLGIGTYDDENARDPFRKKYPEIPKNHHIYRVSITGKTKPVRPQPPSPETIRAQEESDKRVAERRAEFDREMAERKAEIERLIREVRNGQN